MPKCPHAVILFQTSVASGNEPPLLFLSLPRLLFFWSFVAHFASHCRCAICDARFAFRYILKQLRLAPCNFWVGLRFERPWGCGHAPPPAASSVVAWGRGGLQANRNNSALRTNTPRATQTAPAARASPVCDASFMRHRRTTETAWEAKRKRRKPIAVRSLLSGVFEKTQEV